jgi:hypothetical protein
LFQDVPGVRRVIVFPHKGPRLIRRYFSALRALRAQPYDLAIDPTPYSTSGRAILTLCRARFRVGFSASSQWAPLTHAVPLPQELVHQAIQPVFLLTRVLGAPYDPQAVRLWLPLRPAELEAGRAAIAGAIGRSTLRAAALPAAAAIPLTSARAFGFFAHATSFKTIEPQWWRAFWEALLELQPEIIPVEFLPSASTSPIDARFAALHLPSQRALTAAIAATRMFISADTGPMHLASSTSVPTVGLFRASDPALYRPLKPTDLVLDFAQCPARAVAQRCQRIWLQTCAGADASREAQKA